MNGTTIDQDKELADLLAAQRAVPAEAVAAKAVHAEADEAYQAARRRFQTTRARASLGQATAAEAKKTERTLDDAAEALRRAEDELEILGEKSAILAAAIAEARARRRARALPRVKAEGERIAGEAAQAFAILTRLAGESKALKAAIDDDFLLDATAGGFPVHAPEIAQLGSVPALASFLSSKALKELALDKFARASRAGS
jgi:hypothetical protein